MRKTLKRQKFKSNEGITLIALVITVIVLLILAGVAISMLSGENGILKQAANAKTQTEEQSTIEQIKLAAMSALTAGNGKVGSDKYYETLNRELTEAGYNGETITSLPKTIKIGDNEYTITADGKVEEKTTNLEGTTHTETLTDLKEGHQEVSVKIPAGFTISPRIPKPCLGECSQGCLILRH